MIRQPLLRVGLAGFALLLLAGPTLGGTLKPVPMGKTRPIVGRQRVKLQPAPAGSGLTWPKATVGKFRAMPVALDAAADATKPSSLKIADAKGNFAKAITIPFTLRERKFISIVKRKKVAVSYWSAQFHGTVNQTINGKLVPVLVLGYYSQSNIGKPTLMLSTAIRLDGEIKAGKDTCTVSAIDLNGDLKITGREKMELVNGTTKMPVTPNGIVQIGNSVYRLAYDAETNAIFAKDYEGKMGTVTVNLSKFQYTLTSKETGPMTIYGEGETALKIPVGNYQLTKYLVTLNKETDIGYRSIYKAPVTVKAGTKTALPAPKTLIATFRALSGNGKARINVKFTDDLGGRSIMLMKKGNPYPPVFEVVDSGNKVVYTSKLEYG
jgi:hypothetical protein